MTGSPKMRLFADDPKVTGVTSARAFVRSAVFWTLKIEIPVSVSRSLSVASAVTSPEKVTCRDWALSALMPVARIRYSVSVSPISTPDVFVEET